MPGILEDIRNAHRAFTQIIQRVDKNKVSVSIQELLSRTLTIILATHRAGSNGNDKIKELPYLPAELWQDNLSHFLITEDPNFDNVLACLRDISLGKIIRNLSINNFFVRKISNVNLNNAAAISILCNSNSEGISDEKSEQAIELIIATRPPAEFFTKKSTLGYSPVELSFYRQSLHHLILALKAINVDMEAIYKHLEQQGIGKLHIAGALDDTVWAKSIMEEDKANLEIDKVISTGSTPLHYFVKTKDTAFLDYLFSRDDLDLVALFNKGNAELLTPTHFIMRGGHIESLQYMLRNFSKEDLSLLFSSPGMNATPIYFALINDRVEALKEVQSCDKLDMNILLSARNQHQCTPLYFGVQNNSIKCIAAISEMENIDFFDLLNAQITSGNTVMHNACHYSNVETIKTIIKCASTKDDGTKLNALLNVQNATGETALHYACGFKNFQAFREILEYASRENSKIDLNTLLQAQNAQGQTPLHLTCTYNINDANAKEFIETVLKYAVGENAIIDLNTLLNIQDADCKNLMFYAKNNSEILSLLTNYLDSTTQANTANKEVAQLTDSVLDAAGDQSMKDTQLSGDLDDSGGDQSS